jgi:hypothetical protein
LKHISEATTWKQNLLRPTGYGRDTTGRNGGWKHNREVEQKRPKSLEAEFTEANRAWQRSSRKKNEAKNIPKI